jgi:dTDP-4-dehydrorhamnose 3,5-epimerase
MIDGVIITPLKKISDSRGAVLHMLRSDSDVYESFGEIYFSIVYSGIVKAWHFHKHMTINYAVPVGQIKFVLYDDRDDSPSNGEVQEITLGEENYGLVTVPPMIWNGFAGTSQEAAMVANCATHPHDPDEIIRREHNDARMPYDWSKALA